MARMGNPDADAETMVKEEPADDDAWTDQDWANWEAGWWEDVKVEDPDPPSWGNSWQNEDFPNRRMKRLHTQARRKTIMRVMGPPLIVATSRRSLVMSFMVPAKAMAATGSITTGEKGFPKESKRLNQSIASRCGHIRIGRPTRWQLERQPIKANVIALVECIPAVVIVIVMAQNGST